MKRDAGKAFNNAIVEPGSESRSALQSIRSLQEPQPADSLICICAWCNKVRMHNGLWVELGVPGGEGKVTHGICTECARDVRIEISRLYQAQ